MKIIIYNGFVAFDLSTPKQVPAKPKPSCIMDGVITQHSLQNHSGTPSPHLICKRLPTSGAIMNLAAQNVNEMKNQIYLRLLI